MDSFTGMSGVMRRCPMEEFTVSRWEPATATRAAQRMRTAPPMRRSADCSGCTAEAISTVTRASASAALWTATTAALDWADIARRRLHLVVVQPEESLDRRENLAALLFHPPLARLRV